MTTATKDEITLTDRGRAYLKAHGGVLGGKMLPDRCTARHTPLQRCAVCHNTPPAGSLVDHFTEPRELQFSFWYPQATFTVAPNPIDVAMEAAVQPSAEMVAAERLAAEKQAAYDVALGALKAATEERDKARGEMKLVARDGMLFMTGGQLRARLERVVEDARRRMEDAEIDLRRARADFAEHEELLDNQKLVWKDQHRAEFV